MPTKHMSQSWRVRGARATPSGAFRLAAVLTGLALACHADPERLAPEALEAEQARIEDVRKLHRLTVQTLHDARALALYLKGWGGPDRDAEVESLMVEAEGLYGLVRGPDHGALALQAAQDLSSTNRLTPDALALVERARRLAAHEVTAFHTRAGKLAADLTVQIVSQASRTRTWRVVSQPEPWPLDTAREAQRQDGLRFGWQLDARFFEQPAAQQDELLRQAASLGASFTDMDWAPACDWALIEHEPGVFDFGPLDAAIDRLAGHGFQTAPRLRTLTGTPPAWLTAEFGTACRFTTHQRTRTGATTTNVTGVNLFHAPTGQAFTRFLTAYAAHLKTRQPHVKAVYADNQKEIEALADTSAAMEQFWRTWSGTDTPWVTPEQLDDADAPRDENARVRAEACREAWLLAFVGQIRDALKAGWSDLAVQTPTQGDDFHRLIDAHTGPSRDLAALCRLADNPSTATDSPASFALLRSLSEGRPLWSHMVHSGCGTCGSAAVAHAAFYDTAHIVHGGYERSLRADFPNVWFRYPDRRLGDSGIGNHWLTPRRMQEMAPTLLNTRPAPARVAVLWSQTSLRRDRHAAAFKGALAWGHLLQRIHVPYDYLDEAGLGTRLARYRVLILPETQAMPPQSAVWIRDWVRQGGSLLGFGAPGLYDDQGRRNPALPLADVFGADLARLRVPGPIRPDRLETTHPEGSFQFGNLPPRDYKFRSDLTAALAPRDGTPRAWFAGDAEEPAIVEHRFGAGQALLCGFPLGFEYWESAPYELAFGMSHFRHTNYNMEQKRYERWVAAELTRLGLVPAVILSQGRFLRTQRGDDPDWYHIYRDGPGYQEYIFESEQPVRSVLAFPRVREGVDGLYIGLVHTEANYLWERGYFRSTLAGGFVSVDVAIPGAPVPATVTVLDVRLGVPVVCTAPKRAAGAAASEPPRLRFETWVPAAQAALFALSTNATVRLFGPATPPGEAPAELAARVAAHAAGDLPAAIEIDNPAAVVAFLNARRGTTLHIGCGDRRFQPAAQALALWLTNTLAIAADVTLAGPRASCRNDYMDSFGWPSYGGDPLHAEILLGNCQDNGLMWRFLTLHGECGWLPLEVNQDFPGTGRALIMTSMPFVTRADGKRGGKAHASQLVLGASDPGDVQRAVTALQSLFETRSAP